MTNTKTIKLLVDVDGVLAPLGGGWSKDGARNLRRRGFRDTPYRHKIRHHKDSRWSPYGSLWLNPMHGEMLAKFSAEHDVELVWASLWTQNANRVIAPEIGLPRLNWVDFYDHPSTPAVWKWDAVADYCAGSAVAWLDDSFARKQAHQERSSWTAKRKNLPTLLHKTDAYVGLQQSDLIEIGNWIKTVRLAWPDDSPYTEQRNYSWSSYSYTTNKAIPAKRRRQGATSYLSDSAAVGTPSTSSIPSAMTPTPPQKSWSDWIAADAAAAEGTGDSWRWEGDQLVPF